jgi:small subunit ribosomal protein S6
MRRYDTTFIIDGNLPDAERRALIEKFAGILKRQGAEIEQIVRWGLRSLAYPMNKRTHGYYVIFYYRAEAKVIAAFERELRLNESILRYMTLVFEGKHPDYIRDEGTGESAIVVPAVVAEEPEIEPAPDELTAEIDQAVALELEKEGEAEETLPLEAEQDEDETQKKEDE